MKFLVLFVLLLFSMPLSNDKDLFTEAKEESKPVLIYFSGSDWCHNCIKMKNNVIKKDVFSDSILSQVVFYEADFPRQKKMSKEHIAHNEELAEEFNPQGTFPLMVLINSEDRKIISRMGYVSQFSSEDYVQAFQKHLN